MSDYKKLADLTPDGTMYWNDKLGFAQALLPTEDASFTSHAPALLELPNGDILCSWFTGTYEGGSDVHIICSCLKKNAQQWSKPVAISGDPERSEQNPSLFLAPNGEVWSMYTAQLGRQPSKDNMQFTSVIRRQISKDNGKSWGNYDVMFDREGSFCRQPIQILKNGRWIFANWQCTDSPEGLSGDPTVFQISDDGGKSWRQVNMPKSRGRVHANVVELENGHLVAFMRSRNADFIYRSESPDYGDSWSEPAPTVLPNNNSSISAIRLQSGRIAIAYNPTCTAHPQPGKAAWPGLRCPIAVALSEDEGLTFPLIRLMEQGEGYVGAENKTNNRQYEYPFILQGKDGRLHVAFASHTRLTVQYIQFTEEDIIGAKRGEGVYNPTAAVIK